MGKCEREELGRVEEIPFLFAISYLGYTMPENRSSHLILPQAPLVGGSKFCFCAL